MFGVIEQTDLSVYYVSAGNVYFNIVNSEPFDFWTF